MDVSEDALQVAQRNVTLNEVEITFFHADNLKYVKVEESFDIIGRGRSRKSSRGFGERLPLSAIGGSSS